MQLHGDVGSGGGAGLANHHQTVAVIAANQTVLGIQDPFTVHHELVFIDTLTERHGGGPNAVAALGQLVGSGAPAVHGAGQINLGGSAVLITEGNRCAMNLRAEHHGAFHSGHIAIILAFSVGPVVGLHPNLTAAQGGVVDDHISSLAAIEVGEDKAQRLTGNRLIIQFDGEVAVGILVQDLTGPGVQCGNRGTLLLPDMGSHVLPNRCIHKVDLQAGGGRSGLATDGTLVAAVAVRHCHTAGGADTALVMGAVAAAHATTGTSTATPGMRHRCTTNSTLTGCGMRQVLAGAGALGILQRKAAVAVLGQGEGHRHATGNEHLFATPHNELTGGFLAVAFCQIPLAIAFGLNENIRIRGKGSRQLAGRELVGAHVLVVFLTTIVGTVDIANQIVVQGVGRILSATNRTGATGEAMTLGIGVVGLVAVRALGAGVGRIALVRTGGSGHRRRIAVAGGCNGLGVAVRTLGAGKGHHTGLFTGGSGSHLGGVAVGAAGLCLTANCTLVAAVAVVTDDATDRTEAIAPGMGTNRTALGTGITGPVMAAACTTGITLAIGVEQVLTGAGSGAVLQGQRTVGIHRQGKGDFDAGRNIQLVRIGHAGVGIVESSGLGSALEALGHIPIGIVGGLDANIAFLVEGSSQLAGRELIGAHIGSILFTAVVCTVNVAEQVVVHLCRLGGTTGDLAPGAAAVIPCTGSNGIAVVAVGGDTQISGLVPLVIPVVCTAAAIHTTEDHTGVSAGNSTLISAVAIGVRHTDPGFSVAEEIGRKPRAITDPIGVGFQIKRCRRGSESRHRYHAEQHAQRQQDTEEFVHSSLHGIPPRILGRNARC